MPQQPIDKTQLTTDLLREDAIKTAAEIVNNSITLQDDDELFIQKLPIGWYTFEAYLVYDTGAADIKWAFTKTTVSNDSYVSEVFEAASTGYQESHTVSDVSSPVTATQATGGIGVKRHVHLHGSFEVTVAGGGLTLQWAQNSAVVADTTMHPGSWLLVNKVT